MILLLATTALAADYCIYGNPIKTAEAVQTLNGAEMRINGIPWRLNGRQHFPTGQYKTYVSQNILGDYGSRCAISWYKQFCPEDAICDKCRGPVDPDTSVFTENSDLLCGGCKEEG